MGSVYILKTMPISDFIYNAFMIPSVWAKFVNGGQRTKTRAVIRLLGILNLMIKRTEASQ